MAEQQSDEVCNFFRKPSNRNRSNIRKRQTSPSKSDSGSDPDQQPQLQPAKKTLASNKSINTRNLVFSSTSSSSKSKSKSEPEPEPDKLFHFESSNQIQTNDDSRATATLETETDFSRDARAIRERVLGQSRKTLAGSSKLETDEGGVSRKNLYKGIHGYTDYKAGFRREQTIAGEKAGGAHGPLRASAHIRTTARFDYQPDICKDYKETGYCGFGDACKFMHDRGDYKSGWQMEREWEEKEKLRKRAIAMREANDDVDGVDGGDDEDDEDALPFACFICRKPFEDPVVTKCKHYFCEHCALKHHAKNKKCFVCNEPTLGIFNTAHEIRKRMAQEKQ